MAARRKECDWEGIEREFRAGVSYRNIGLMFSVSYELVRKQAISEGWTRDRTAEVRSAVRTKLLEPPIVDSAIVDDNVVIVDAEAIRQQIELAADVRVALVRSHQKRFAALHAISDKLTTRLDIVMDGGTLDGKPCLGDRESPADLLTKLSNITARLVPLERQAFCLDEPSDTPVGDGATPVLDGLMRELNARRQRLEATEMPADEGAE